MPYVILSAYDDSVIGVCKKDEVNAVIKRLTNTNANGDTPRVENLKRKREDLLRKIERLKSERPRVELKGLGIRLPDKVLSDIRNMEKYASIEFNKTMDAAQKSLKVVEDQLKAEDRRFYAVKVEVLRGDS